MKKDKLYIIRKYIKASSAQEAIKLDKTTPVDDVWVDDNWKKKEEQNLASAIGFAIEEE